jgi:hypothetical protein
MRSPDQVGIANNLPLGLYNKPFLSMKESPSRSPRRSKYSRGRGRFHTPSSLKAPVGLVPYGFLDQHQDQSLARAAADKARTIRNERLLHTVSPSAARVVKRGSPRRLTIELFPQYLDYDDPFVQQSMTKREVVQLSATLQNRIHTEPKRQPANMVKTGDSSGRPSSKLRTTKSTSRLVLRNQPKTSEAHQASKSPGIIAPLQVKLPLKAHLPVKDTSAKRPSQESLPVKVEELCAVKEPSAVAQNESEVKEDIESKIRLALSKSQSRENQRPTDTVKSTKSVKWDPAIVFSKPTTDVGPLEERDEFQECINAISRLKTEDKGKFQRLLDALNKDGEIDKKVRDSVPKADGRSEKRATLNPLAAPFRDFSSLKNLKSILTSNELENNNHHLYKSARKQQSHKRLPINSCTFEYHDPNRVQTQESEPGLGRAPDFRHNEQLQSKDELLQPQINGLIPIPWTMVRQLVQNNTANQSSNEHSDSAQTGFNLPITNSEAPPFPWVNNLTQVPWPVMNYQNYNGCLSQHPVGDTDALHSYHQQQHQYTFGSSPPAWLPNQSPIALPAVHQQVQDILQAQLQVNQQLQNFLGPQLQANMHFQGFQPQFDECLHTGRQLQQLPCSTVPNVTPQTPLNPKADLLDLQLPDWTKVPSLVPHPSASQNGDKRTEFQRPATSQSVSRPGNKKRVHSHSHDSIRVPTVPQSLRREPVDAQAPLPPDPFSDAEKGREASVLEREWAERMLGKFSEKYPMTGTVKSASQGSFGGQFAADLQQRLEYLIMQDKETKALQQRTKIRDAIAKVETKKENLPEIYKPIPEQGKILLKRRATRENEERTENPFGRLTNQKMASR